MNLLFRPFDDDTGVMHFSTKESFDPPSFTVTTA